MGLEHSGQARCVQVRCRSTHLSTGLFQSRFGCDDASTLLGRGGIGSSLITVVTGPNTHGPIPVPTGQKQGPLVVTGDPHIDTGQRRRVPTRTPVRRPGIVVRYHLQLQGVVHGTRGNVERLVHIYGGERVNGSAMDRTRYEYIWTCPIRTCPIRWRIPQQHQGSVVTAGAEPAIRTMIETADPVGQWWRRWLQFRWRRGGKVGDAERGFERRSDATRFAFQARTEQAVVVLANEEFEGSLVVGRCVVCFVVCIVCCFVVVVFMTQQVVQDGRQFRAADRGGHGQDIGRDL